MSDEQTTWQTEEDPAKLRLGIRNGRRACLIIIGAAIALAYVCHAILERFGYSYDCAPALEICGLPELNGLGYLMTIIWIFICPLVVFFMIGQLLKLWFFAGSRGL
jgi:hypothetical protein